MTPTAIQQHPLAPFATPQNPLAPPNTLSWPSRWPLLHGWQWFNGGWPMPNSVPAPSTSYQQAPTIDGHYNLVMSLPPNEFSTNTTYI
jgi:hypothetical protein